jgi:hypothetical protein
MKIVALFGENDILKMDSKKHVYRVGWDNYYVYEIKRWQVKGAHIELR